MEHELSLQEKKTLLKLARDTIAQYLVDGGRPSLPEAAGMLGESCGAFVTLHERGRLRGCIGNMIGRGPLVELVQEMSIAAATQDPRFHKLSKEELGEIDIEISVLSPMKRIADVEEIEVGKHGILMSRGICQGVLLPQVPAQFGWDREAFLQNTCLKAGLPEDAWNDPETTIEIFSAQVFGEKDGDERG